MQLQRLILRRLQAVPALEPLPARVAPRPIPAKPETAAAVIHLDVRPNLLVLTHPAPRAAKPTRRTSRTWHAVSTAWWST